MESYNIMVERLDKMQSRSRELEEILIGADLGVQTSLKLIEKLRLVEKSKKIESTEEIQQELQSLIEEILNNNAQPMNLKSGRVNFILIAKN